MAMAGRDYITKDMTGLTLGNLRQFSIRRGLAHNLVGDKLFIYRMEFADIVEAVLKLE